MMVEWASDSYLKNYSYLFVENVKLQVMLF